MNYDPTRQRGPDEGTQRSCRGIGVPTDGDKEVFIFIGAAVA